MQEEYCKKHKVPLFAPKQCQHKNKWHSAPDLPNDFNELFSIEEASMGLITGCKCGKSWCD